MACEQHLVWIQETVDGTIGSIRRAQLDMHLAECADCRALLNDLRRIHDAAASLEAVALPDRAWLQIAGRLRLEGRIREDAVPPRAARRSYHPYAAWLGIAAALVLAAGSAIVLLIPRDAPAPAQTATATTSRPAGASTAAPD